MKKILLTFSAVIIAVALTPAAFASSLLTAINFTCSGEGVAGPGNTSTPIGSGCNPVAVHPEGLNPSSTPTTAANWSGTWYQQATSPLTNYYTVTSLTGDNVNPGNPYVSSNAPGNGEFVAPYTASPYNYIANDGFNYTAGQTTATISTSTNNGIPALRSSNSGGVKQLEITDSTGTFLFNGLFYGESTSNQTLSYMIFGYNGNTLVYCINSDGNSCSDVLSSAWDTYTPSGTVATNDVNYSLLSLPSGDANDPVTTVYIDSQIAASSNAYQYFDNYLVTQTPEPGSFVLLSSGLTLMGLTVFFRPRRATVRPLVNGPTAN